MDTSVLDNSYLGLNIAQYVFAFVILLFFIGFAVWGYRTRQRIQRLEEALRDFRELEPEGYEEEDTRDSFSEGARLQADEEASLQNEALKHQG
ncbi:MAG: hypothetical protein M1539_02735 [Actinobacteria bacterium]|nr:hypothetical protein [Actinomycetota bacterium]